jgi:hypothetical protein
MASGQAFAWLQDRHIHGCRTGIYMATLQKYEWQDRHMHGCRAGIYMAKGQAYAWLQDRHMHVYRTDMHEYKSSICMATGQAYAGSEIAFHSRMAFEDVKRRRHSRLCSGRIEYLLKACTWKLK